MMVPLYLCGWLVLDRFGVKNIQGQILGEISKIK